jgi:hypothetical protein
MGVIMPHLNPDGAPSNGQTLERNRLEIIRFTTAEAQRQAIRGLIDHGMLNFTAHQEKEWLVYTPVARALRQLGVPFEWLTENV